jgi:hypothetical protein
MANHQTVLHIFSRGTIAAIRIALNPRETARVRRLAERSAYQQARALGREGLRVLAHLDRMRRLGT